MKQPALKYLIFLLIGIAAGFQLPMSVIASIILLLVALGLLLLSLKFAGLNKIYPLCVILTGVVLAQSASISKIEYPNKIRTEFSSFFKGEVEKVLLESGQSNRYIVNGILRTSIAEPCEARLQLKIWNKGRQKKFIAGDSIIGNIKVKAPATLTLPEDFNGRVYAESQSIDFFARASSGDVAVVSRNSGFEDNLAGIRADIRNRLSSLFSITSFPIILALLTGDKSEINYSVKDDFSITGTAHVLAVSGLHTGIISAILIVLLGWIRSRTFKFITFTVLLSAYVFYTGMQPSAIRAGLMAILVFIVYMSQRHTDLLNILSFSVIVILIIEPSMIHSVGFQMSAGALLGIALFYNPMLRFFDMLFRTDGTITNFIKSSLSITLAVGIILTPIVAYYFGTFSIISPLANLIIVPAITIAMVYGLLSLALSYIFLPLALIYSRVAEITTELILAVNRQLSSLPFSSVEFAEPVLISVIISAAIIYVVTSTRNRQAIFRFFVSFSAITIIIVLLETGEPEPVIIHNRENAVVIFTHSPKENFCIILDRRPKIKSINDYPLLNHLKKKANDYTYLISGNTGINIVDNLNETGKVKYKELNIEQIREILETLQLSPNIYHNLRVENYECGYRIQTHMVKYSYFCILSEIKLLNESIGNRSNRIRR